jgi:hypothetical protein
MQLTSRYSQYTIVALMTGLALALLMLAWPRLWASIRYLPVDLAIERYYAEREIPTQRMLTLIGFAGQALERHDHYRYHDGLSLLHYLRGLDVYTPALERREAYRAAEAEALATVRRAPAQPEAWLRASAVRAVLRDEPEQVLAPWRMSVFTGRTHSTLLAPRVGIALPYLEVMDAETRSMLRDQWLLAWRLKPGELWRELMQSDPALQRTRALIAPIAPDVMSELEARLEKAR